MSYTAVLVKTNLEGFRGEANLYRVEPPLKDGTEFVVSSSIATSFDYHEPETMVFAANEDGEIVDWEDLGLVRGYNSDAEALANAGIEAVVR